MKTLTLLAALTFCAPAAAEPAHPTPTAPSKAKVVSVDIIDLDVSYDAKVRVGDTLEVVVLLHPGFDWKVVGEPPTNMKLLPGYLSPTVNAYRYQWKIAAPTGKRVIKFERHDEQDPKAAPEVVTLNVEVKS